MRELPGFTAITTDITLDLLMRYAMLADLAWVLGYVPFNAAGFIGRLWLVSRPAVRCAVNCSPCSSLE